MSGELSKEILYLAVREVMEDAALVSTGRINTEPVPGNRDGHVMEGILPFYGPQKGHLMLAAPFPLWVRVMQNMLGAEDVERAEQWSLDAIRKILDIVGSVLMDCWFGDEVYHIGTAEVRLVPTDAALSRKRGASASVTLLADGEYLVDSWVIIEEHG